MSLGSRRRACWKPLDSRSSDKPSEGLRNSTTPLDTTAGGTACNVNGREVTVDAVVAAAVVDEVVKIVGRVPCMAAPEWMDDMACMARGLKSRFSSFVTPLCR